MTITEIHKAVRQHKKISERSLYLYLHRFRIKPVGIRQRPQRYPHDAPARILKALGVSTSKSTR